MPSQGDLEEYWKKVIAFQSDLERLQSLLRQQADELKTADRKRFDFDRSYKEAASTMEAVRTLRRTLNDLIAS